eukprot:6303401-Amphidinium_carterae.2
MDLGYLPWSNKGNGKDSKGKGHKVDKGKVTRTAGGTTVERDAKGSRKTKETRATDKENSKWRKL